MLKMLVSGAQWFCDACSRPIVDVEDGVGLFRPLRPGVVGDAADVLVVHAACREENMVKVLLPQRSKRPLAALLRDLDEVLNR
jgi:hypothetical protein